MTVMAMSTISPRTAAVAGGVVLLHVLALWALNAGLLRQATEVFVPVQMLSELITPAEPQVQPTPAPPPKPQPMAQQPVARRKPVAPAPAPRPIAPRERPSPNAPAAVAEPQPPSPPAPPAPAIATAAGPTVEAPPAPAKVELPSTNAEYLQNPAPNYPPASRRAGEQGKVIVRVLIGTDGTAKEVELRQSSGFDRLDRAALETVRKWRYVPGKRNGVPEAMWFNVPINFVLE
ncbi:energy transducer TonB [Ramlibacter sp. MMS24-I3-19]|uniref:energy transducer TonB n=1 Tax=Ramlibacter sp. MMS24-I3-19 TaxID=3416606 RepID=UPI003CFDFAA5